MRRRATIVLAVGLCAGCRATSKQEAPIAAVPDAGPSPLAPLKQSKEQVRFARPLAASYSKGKLCVAARDRASLALTAACWSSNDPGQAPLWRKAIGPAAENDEVTVFGSSSSAIVMHADHATGQRGLYRLVQRAEGDVDLGPRTPIGPAFCSTSDGVAFLLADDQKWQPDFLPFDSGGTAGNVTPIPRAAEATLACGNHRVFVGSLRDSTVRIASWLPLVSQPDLVESSLSERQGHPIEELPQMITAGDTAMLLRAMPEGTIASWSWDGSRGPTKALAPIREIGADRSIEAADATQTSIGLVVTHEVASSSGCPKREDATDTVAEVMVASASDGGASKLQKIETWRCGAEPGPFWTGWAGAKLVVAWPRGGDSACARAGVPYGGIGYAVIDEGGQAKIGRAGRPAEAFAFAGCDAGACYAVSLVRGSEPCAPADAPGAGEIRVVTFP